MYKISPLKNPDGSHACILLIVGNATTAFPFSKTNTDYQKFKKDLQEGVSLQDTDGNEMTAEQIADFLATLP